MDIPFEEIFHLEEFLVEGQRFIKISEPVIRGRRQRPKTVNKKANAIRRPGISKLVYFSPETIVQRIEH